MEFVTDILVLPFFGQGHIFPFVELCKRFASYNCRSILIIPSHLSSSIPSSLHHHPLVEVLQIHAPYSHLPPPPPPHLETIYPQDVPGGEWSGPEKGPGLKPGHQHQQMGTEIESFLSERYKNVQPGCVVIDVMMSWSKEIFKRANIPIVSFFTSGACATAMEYAEWKAHVDDMEPNETRILPGLPESMALSYSDVQRRDRPPHDHHGGKGGRPGGMNFGPPKPGQPPSWKDEGRPGGMTFGPPRPGQPPSWMNEGRPGGMNFCPPKPGQPPSWMNEGRPGGMNFAPPKPGLPPCWLDEAEGSTALLINTCDDIEGPFLKYTTEQIEKPVFGVGPLLPETYWKSTSSVLHDRDSRANHESNYTEDEVIQWLDSKPHRSVIYVSFGSEVGPTLEEYDQLADGLGDSNQSFIWVIQAGAGTHGPPPNMFGGKPGSNSEGESYYPQGMEERVGDRGLIIKGWAPQLSILSHPSTGGFLSHCGWNSMMEAIGCGVPILAWPIRGDQIYNAKLAVKYLKVGIMVSSGDDLSEMVKKFDIKQGIEVLMNDGEVRDRAIALRGMFKAGYPSSSEASLKALIELISK